MKPAARRRRPIVSSGVPDYTQLAFPEPPGERPYVILNMVTSIDGKGVAGATESGLGSQSDRHLMSQLRVHADVILVGAGTFRASGASPLLWDQELEALRVRRNKPRFAVSATISRSGNLPLERLFFTSGDFAAVVYLHEGCAAGPRAALAATGRTVVTLPEASPLAAMLAHMRGELAAEILLLEGGAELNAQFFAADLVDEFFVTIGPLVVGGRDVPTAVGGTTLGRDGMLRFALEHCFVNASTDEVYLRYRRAK